MGAKILVADDSALAAKMLANVLKTRGYDVVMAANGIEAVQSVYSEAPALVLLDIFMPHMNGYQACRLLKDDPEVAHIPIVILTGSDSRSAESWSLQTGADAFMTKGFDPTDLVTTIERLLAAQTHAEHSLQAPPGPADILSKLSILMDRELYSSTIERTELRTVLQNLTDGVLTMDMQGTVTRANRALGQMLGVDEKALLGRHCSEVLSEQAGETTLALFAAATAGEPAEMRDTELLSKSGGATPVAVTVALLHDYLGEAVGCVCMFQDFTRRKEVEALYEKLSALDKAKEDLTHMIVHDLRTPLTSVIMGLQLLDDGGDLNEIQQEMAGIALSGGQSLLGMINNLLDISKMEAGALELDRETVLPAALVGSALDQVATLAGDKSIELVAQVPADLPSFAGDEDKLRRVLVNLVGNAIKFTPAGGQIIIQAQASGDGGVTFAVRDTGEGIPAEAFAHIFEKFGQVESRSAGRQMSTGLGLAFCKMAVEAHGGRIWVESSIGAGSVFYFTIPGESG